MLGGFTFTTQLSQAMKEEWIHRDGSAVRLQARLIVNIDELVLNVILVDGAHVNIFGVLSWEEQIQLAAHTFTINLDEEGLHHLSFFGGNVLGGYVGVGIQSRASSCIGSTGITFGETDESAQLGFIQFYKHIVTSI